MNTKNWNHALIKKDKGLLSSPDCTIGTIMRRQFVAYAIAMLLLVLGVSGCSNNVEVDSHFYISTYDDAYTTVIDTGFELLWDVRLADKDSGIIVFDIIPKRWLKRARIAIRIEETHERSVRVKAVLRRKSSIGHLMQLVHRENFLEIFYKHLDDAMKRNVGNALS